MSGINSPIPQGYAANVPAIDCSSGVALVPAQNAGCTLVSGHNYAYPLGGPRSQLVSTTPLASAQVKWLATFVGTITIETTNFPRFSGGEVAGGVAEESDYDATTKGGWIQELPPNAYISTTSSDGTTGGATVSRAVITVAGGTAGGAMIHVGNLGSLRMRLKIACTTGDVVRVGVNGKP